MTLSQYLDQFPDYGKDEETIAACLTDAEYIVNHIAHTRGKTLPQEAHNQAAGFHTAFMLKNCGEDPGDCEEAGLSTISTLARAGILL